MSTSAPDTMNQLLVSVIIPTYNYGSLISETLISLQRQTLKRWECIIVDDGSSDNTAGVVDDIARRDPRIRYLRQANQRQAAAKNLGLAHARGEYVQFLDADDFIESHKLERHVTYLEEHPKVGIVYGNARYFRTGNENERLYSMCEDNKPWMPEISGEGREVVEALVRDNIMVINAALIRRRIVDEVGPFDVRLPPAEDWDYWLRCALVGTCFQFVDIEDTLALVRVHPESSSQNRFRMQRATVFIREKLASSVKDEQILALNRELRARDEKDLALMEAARRKSLAAAWRLIRSAWFEGRWKWKTKLFACAVVAPLVTETRLRSLISSSLTGSVRNLGGKGGSG